MRVVVRINLGFSASHTTVVSCDLAIFPSVHPDPRAQHNEKTTNGTSTPVFGAQYHKQPPCAYAIIIPVLPILIYL